MKKIERTYATLLLPEDGEAPFFTVCCIGDRETADTLARILPPGEAAIVCPAEKWNDLSPFPAPALEPGEKDFTPGARRMLDRIGYALSSFAAEYPLRQDPDGHGLMGYSLAGLCVLYALHIRMDEFRWFYALSPSVWMEGWREFAAAHPPRRDAHVWLSLGGKEPATKNPRMARVGKECKEEERLLKMILPRGNVRMTWHPGGHFADVSKRMLAALNWKALDKQVLGVYTETTAK